MCKYVLRMPGGDARVDAYQLVNIGPCDKRTCFPFRYIVNFYSFLKTDY